MAMIIAARNVSRDYKLPEREIVLGPLLDKFFENNIKNQRERLINKAYIYGLRFQSDVETINYTPLLNILAGGFHLPVSV